MKPAIALENIRSAYNVGNIIRTADGLGFDVILLGYSSSPFENEKVLKTSLGAEKNVNLKQFYNVKKGLDYIKENYSKTIWAEITANAIPLNKLRNNLSTANVCIIVGNEVSWISIETMEQLDIVSFIPMQWIKNSLNVCEAASIFMREINRELRTENLEFKIR